MKTTKVLTLFLFLLSITLHANEPAKDTVSGMAAFERLQLGNSRFSSGKPVHPNQDVARREKLASGQQPHSIVISCSDSRVPPEQVFDMGLGEIFSIRVAGEVLSPESIASIEYAIEHLGSKLIVVMGHESCGAVKAAMTTPKGTTAGSENLDQMLEKIRPNLEFPQSRSLASADSTLRAPVKAQVDGVMKELLLRSKIVRNAVKKNQVVLANGIYSLRTGAVDFWDVGKKYESLY